MKITLEFEHPWELTNLLKELSKNLKTDLPLLSDYLAKREDELVKNHSDGTHTHKRGEK